MTVRSRPTVHQGGRERTRISSAVRTEMNMSCMCGRATVAVMSNVLLVAMLSYVAARTSSAESRSAAQTSASGEASAKMAQTPPAMTFMAIDGFMASRQVKQTMEWNNRIEVPVCLDCWGDGAVEHQCRAD